MAIIERLHDIADTYPEHSFCFIASKKNDVYGQCYVGRCIESRNRNDCMEMLIWNDEFNEPEWIDYEHPLSAVDVTSDVMPKYHRHERKRNIEERLNARQRDMVTSNKAGFLSYHDLRKFRSLIVDENIRTNLIDFLSIPDKNKFKKSLEDQVWAWFYNDKREYKTPLSPKQMKYLFM